MIALAQDNMEKDQSSSTEQGELLRQRDDLTVFTPISTATLIKFFDLSVQRFFEVCAYSGAAPI